MKTEKQDIYRNFQRFLVSATIELDVHHIFNDSVFDLGLIVLQLFYVLYLLG